MLAKSLTFMAGAGGRRHRAGRARAADPGQPRRFRGDPARFLRGGGAGRAPQAAPANACLAPDAMADADHVLVLNTGSSSIKFSLFGGAAPALLLKGRIENLFSGADPLHRAGRSATTPCTNNPGRMRSTTRRACAPCSTSWPASQADTRCAQWGTASSMAARATAARCCWTTPCWTSSTRWCRWRRCTCRTTWRRCARRSPWRPACPRSAASTPPFTGRNRNWRRPSRCRPTSPGAASAAMDFTDCPTNTSPAACRQADPALATAKVVAAHLGNGASMCAMHGGRSMASSMGFTAVDGLPMGTRCGAVDPGVVLYLIDQLGMDVKAVQDLLYLRFGPAGRLRHLGRHAHARSERGAARTACDRPDGLPDRPRARFDGGRAGRRRCAGVLRRDRRKQRRAARGSLPRRGMAGRGARSGGQRGPGTAAWPGSAPPSSKVSVWIVPANEELMIARHTLDVLA